MGLFDKIVDKAKDAVADVFGGSSNDTSSSSSGFSAKVDRDTPKTVSGGSSATRTASVGRSSSSGTGVSVSNPSGNKGTIDISSPPNLGKINNPLHAAVRTASAKRRMDEAANALNQAQTNLGYADQWNEADLRHQMEDAQKAYDEAKAAYEEETAPKYKSSEDLNTKAVGAKTSEALNGQTLSEQQKRPMTGNSMSEALANSRKQEDTNIFRQDVADAQEETKPYTPHNSLLDAVLTKPNGDRYNSLYDKILAEQPETLPEAPAPMEVPQMNGRKGPLTMEQILAHQANSSWRDNLTQDGVKEEAQAAPQDVNTPKTPDFIQTNEERDALIAELRGMGNPNYLSAADRKAYIDHRNEIRDRLDAIDEQLGNGHMDYTFGDRLSSVLSGSVKGYGGDLLNSAATVAEGMSQLGEQLGGDTGEYAGWATDDVSRAAIPYESDEEKYAQQRQEVADIQKVADDLAQDSAEDINRAKNGVGGVGRFAIDVGTNAIQMGMDGLAAVLTGGGSLAPMFFRTMGGSAREARRDGANIGQQILYGTVKGGIEVATEKVFDGLAGVYGKGTADEAVEKLIQKLGHGNDAQMTALRVFFSGLGEAAEEGMSGAADPFTQMIYQGIESFPNNANADWISDTLYSMAVGFAMGSAGGGVNIVNGENARLNADAKSQIDAVEQMNQRGAQAQPITESTAESAPEEAPRAPSPIKPSSLEETDSGTRAADAPVQQAGQTATEAEAETEATPTTTPDTRSGEQVTVEPTLSRTSKPETADQPTTPTNPLVDQPTTTTEAESTETEAPETPKRTVEEIDAEIAPIQAEIDEIDNLIAENQEAARQQASQQPTLAEAQAIQQQAQNVVDSLNEQKAPLQERVDALNAERRAVTSEQNRAAEQKRWENREAKGAKKVPNPQPETHIDNRTTESVGKSNVNAFQYDNPEVKPFYKRAAEILMRDLGYMQSSKRSERGNGTVYGASNQFLEKVSSYFGSLNDAIEACEQIIYDKGRENFADPKRIELFLDEMLSNGYDPVDTSLPPIQSSAEYLELKGRLQGGTQFDPRARAIQAEIASDFTGSMTEAEAGEIVDRNYAETGFYDPYTRDGQEDTSRNEGRQSFKDIDAADTASVEAKYGRSNATENASNTAESASETPQSTKTPTTSETASTGETGELNSKSESQNGDNQNVPPNPPQQPTGEASNSTYEELGERYGTIEPGENPVRESNTPRRTSDDTKVSQAVRTTMEAEATPESRLDDIKNAVVNGEFSYVAVSNDARSQAAEAKIKSKGWSAALRDWTSAVRSGQANADLVAEGAVLMNNAANSSECTGRDYIDLMTDYVNLEHTLGQGLQASRILKTLSPEGRLYAIQKVVSGMNETANSSKGSKKTDAVDTLADTADGKYSIPEDLVDEYRQQTTDEGRDAVIDKMQQAIADQIPSTLADKFTAIRYLNMLGNLKTQVRNVAGNTGMLLVQKAKNTVRAAFETIASMATGGKYEKQYSSVYGLSLWNAAWTDIQKTSGLKESAMGEKKYSSAASQFSKGIEDKRTIFKFGDNKLTQALGIANKQGVVGKALTAYNNVTSWAMEAGDDIFVSLNYADSLAGYLKAHNISAEQWAALTTEADMNMSSDAAKIVDNARAFAVKQAQEATFRDTNRISEFAQNFDKNWGKAKIITQGIAPFRKTPANVGVRMEEYSPLGLINTTVKAVQAAKGKGNVTGADVVDSLSKSITGTGLALIGFALAQAGRARTKSDDDKQEAFDKLRGLQDYSITVGDGINLTLDWAVPASASLFMGVEFYNLVRDGSVSPDDAMKIMGNLTAPMLEMSMLSGLNDALNNISNFNEDTDALPQFLLNSAVGYLTQGMTNTLAGQFEQASEEYRQSYYTNSENKLLPTSLQKKLAQAGNKTPGVDYHAADYIDAWGRKQENGSAATRYFNALVNPAYTSNLESRSTEIDDELQRLYDYGKDIDGFPSVIPQQVSRNTKVNGTRLSPEEYETYATTIGQERLRLATELINSDLYSALSDDAKAKAIQECYSFAKSRAEQQIADAREEEYDNQYSTLITGVDKSGTAYDKTGLDSDNFVDYTALKTGLDLAVKAQDYDAINDLVQSYGKLNSNTKTVLSERDNVLRALVTWKNAGFDSETYYDVQKQLVASQNRLDKSQKTGSAVELDALAHVNMPESQKRALINALDSFGSKTVTGVYNVLSDYGFNAKQINDFWTQSQNWVYKDTGAAQSSTKAGTLQPLEAAYAISQLPGLTDAQRSEIYARLKEIANVPYAINDWKNYNYSSEINYLKSGRASQQFNPLTSEKNVKITSGTDKTKITVSGRK